MAVLLHRLGEDHHLDRGLEVLQHEDGHQVALLGPLPLQGGDQPADHAHAAVLDALELGERALGAPAQRGLGPHERVVAHVEPEHLLLERQALLLVELDGRGWSMRGLGRRAVAAAVVVEHREQVELALGLAAASPERRVEDLLVHRQQALTRMAQRVETARLDQRLDGALVEHRQVDAVAEVVEVGERSVGVALGSR